MPNTTMNTNMFVPEVISKMVQAELEKQLRFSDLVEINTDLVGVPGDKVVVPAWKYIGDAEDVAENTAIPIKQMGHDKTEMTIKKAGIGVRITDEAMTRGYGDPLGEAIRQLGMSIANKVDNDIAEALSNGIQKHTAPITDLNVINDAINTFHLEEEEPNYILFANRKTIQLLKDKLRAKDPTLPAVPTETLAAHLGVAIRVSNKLEDGQGILYKGEGIKLVSKRGVEIEGDRDIEKKATLITADKHYGVYQSNELSTITIGFATTSTGA